jgi:AhpC/TSA family
MVPARQSPALPCHATDEGGARGLFAASQISVPEEPSMAVTIIYEDKPASVANAQAQGADLWMPTRELQAATGWELKPQGLCRDERCVPIPPARRDQFLRAGDMVNLAALARQLDQPVVHDDSHALWFFGESANSRRETLASLEAPDFTLPDIDGNLHSLSDYRGRKVLLLSWASW